MFDKLVKAGLSPQDSVMVEKAQGHAAQVVAAAEAAIAAGELTMEQLFDCDYREVPGTNPQLYRTGLSDWADAHWRPINDAVSSEGRPVIMCSQDTCQRTFAPADRRSSA